MIVRQEENTPIGNYFHDNGILKVFDMLQNEVDEFEVETENIKAYCDNLITSLKGLKSITEKTESEYAKKKAQRNIKDKINAYN